MTHPCQKCNCPCDSPEDEYGEFICQECINNAAEAAHERHMAAFHDGGAIAWKTLLQQEQEARKLK